MVLEPTQNLQSVVWPVMDKETLERKQSLGLSPVPGSSLLPWYPAVLLPWKPHFPWKHLSSMENSKEHIWAGWSLEPLSDKGSDNSTDHQGQSRVKYDSVISLALAEETTESCLDS